MTKQRQDSILSASNEIRKHLKMIDDIERARRYSGDSISGHLSLSERLATVVKNNLSEIEASTILNALEAQAKDALEIMVFSDTDQPEKASR